MLLKKYIIFIKGESMEEKKSYSLVDIVKGIGILIVLCVILFVFLGYIFEVIENLVIWIGEMTSKMDAVVIVALITGAVSISGVVLSSIVSKVLEYRQNIKRYLYEKREEPYSEFIEMVYKIQKNAKDSAELPEEEILQDTMNFSKKLTLWGSNRVIKKWLDFRRNGQEENVDSMKNLLVLEEIIFEMRRDMGHNKIGLKQGDILSFFINDIKEYLRDKK
ncbi:hypothetical protein HMPREF0379_0081 [[Eubacterium] yurii subsp. margaretiae ATCC 43715]|nr:hypothetical protein HMPREF0379_0081 [[Eubacterium] yurii subsp. margaretiae ATCC 43715]